MIASYQEPESLTLTPSEPGTAAGAGRGRPPAWSDAVRATLVLVVCLVVAVPVILAFASSPPPSTSAVGASLDPSAATDATTEPSKGLGNQDGKKDRREWTSRGRLNGGPGKNGHGNVTITAINGSDVPLATDDGWKRTITLTSDTIITMGGATVTVGDLDVGDQIRFLQKRNDDGTYTVTRIVVPTPTTGGEVTAVSGDSITIKQRDGSSPCDHRDGIDGLHTRARDGLQVGRRGRRRPRGGGHDRRDELPPPCRSTWRRPRRVA